MINFSSSKLKEFADDDFEFVQNGRQFSKRVENTVGKGELAHYASLNFVPQRSQTFPLLRILEKTGFRLFCKAIRSWILGMHK